MPGSLRDGRLWRSHPALLGVLGLYVLWCTLNVQLSVAPEISFLHWWMRASLPLSAFAALYVVTTQRHGHNAISFLLVGVCLIGALWGDSEFVRTPQRVNGPFVDPNNLAMVCLFGLLLLLPLVLSSDDSRRRDWRLTVGVWAALMAFIFGVFATFSRAVILMSVIALAVVMLVRWWRRESLREAMGLLAMAAASYVCTAYFAPVANSRFTKEGDFTLGLDVRYAMWRATVRMWLEHPWFGSGLGTFRIQYPFYRELVDQFTGGNTPHNDYLTLLYEGGPVLLGFLLLFVGVVVLGGVRVLRSALRREANFDWQKFVIVLAIGAVLAHAIINFISILEVWHILLGCALVLLLARFRDGVAVPVMANERAPRLVTALCTAVLLLPLRGLAVDAASYGIILKQVGVPYAEEIRSDGRLYLHAMSMLQTLAPDRGLPPYGEAYYLNLLALDTPPPFAKQFAGRAARAYQKSLDNFPFTLRVIVSYAQLYALPFNRDLPRAERIALRAMARDPTDLTAVIMYNNVLAQEGRKREAYIALRDRMLPWAVLNTVRYPLETEAALQQLRRSALEFGEGPPLAVIDKLLIRATRDAATSRAAAARAKAKRTAAAVAN